MKKHLQNKNLYDKKCKGPEEFNVGDRVLVGKHAPVNNIDDHYQSEIHEVVSLKSQVVYRVKGFETSIIKCYYYQILFKERTAVQETPNRVIEVPSWHDDTRTVKTLFLGGRLVIT